MYIVYQFGGFIVVHSKALQLTSVFVVCFPDFQVASAAWKESGSHQHLLGLCLIFVFRLFFFCMMKWPYSVLMIFFVFFVLRSSLQHKSHLWTSSILTWEVKFEHPNHICTRLAIHRRCDLFCACLQEMSCVLRPVTHGCLSVVYLRSIKAKQSALFLAFFAVLLGSLCQSSWFLFIPCLAGLSITAMLSFCLLPRFSEHILGGVLWNQWLFWYGQASWNMCAHLRKSMHHLAGVWLH